MFKFHSYDLNNTLMPTITLSNKQLNKIPNIDQF